LRGEDRRRCNSECISKTDFNSEKKKKEAGLAFG
jgi:hypothetical protein